MTLAHKYDYTPIYSYEDYLHWEGKWELIYGTAFAMSPMPMPKHQKISNKIARYLDEALEKCQACQALLPVDWKIDNSTVVQPDNLVVCNEPLDKSYIQKAPKIIFEILSPSTMQKDLHLKYELYQNEGVEYYVIIDPNDSFAKIYRLRGGKYIKYGEACHESIAFEIEECGSVFEFNFGLIW